MSGARCGLYGELCVLQDPWQQYGDDDVYVPATVGFNFDAGSVGSESSSGTRLMFPARLKCGRVSSWFLGGFTGFGHRHAVNIVGEAVRRSQLPPQPTGIPRSVSRSSDT
jgi:hypothetical protein